jgi:RNA polymerase sigma-70 factor (ECF subfamily)
MGRSDIRRQLQEHYLDFFSVAMAMLRDEQDARDAVQEALAKTMMKFRLKDPCGFCFTTLKHQCLDMLHHRNRMVSIEEDMLTVDPEHEEMLRIVREKKEELGEMARMVLELHDEEDYTMNEIAVMLHVSSTTVKRILYGAREEMRKKLRNEI